MSFQAFPYFPDNQPEMYSMQQECSKPSEIVMIELYCCGPGLLFWLLLLNKYGILGLQGSVAKILQPYILLSQPTCRATVAPKATLSGNHLFGNSFQSNW